MANKRKLKYRSKKELAEKGMKSKKHEAKFDTKKLSKSAKDDIKKWTKSREVPKDLPKPKRHKLKGVQFKAVDVKRLHTMHKSKSPIMEAMDQEMGPEDLLDLSYSVLTVHQYQEMQEEYEKRLKEAKSKKEEAQIKKEWKELVKGAIKGFQRAGVKGLKQADLDNMSSEIKKDPIVAKSIKKIAESGLRERETSGNPDYAAGEIPIVTVVADAVEDIVEAYFDLCKNPIEDIYKWNYTFSFAWKINLKIWCPTWYNPWRFCWITFTIAGISAGVSLEVGYRITCTGASAWGIANAYTCATLLGISYCFECTAEVVGVLGFTEFASDDHEGCVYGAGVNCEFTCTWRGIPIVFLTAGLGLVVKAPCPTATLEEWAVYLIEKAKEELEDSEEDEEEEEP